jgi:hypothetical protein
MAEVEAAVDMLAEAEAAHAVVDFREAAVFVAAVAVDFVAAAAGSAAAMGVVSGAAMEAAVTMAAVGTAGRVFT